LLAKKELRFSIEDKTGGYVGKNENSDFGIATYCYLLLLNKERAYSPLVLMVFKDKKRKRLFNGQHFLTATFTTTWCIFKLGNFWFNGDPILASLCNFL